MIKWDSIIKSCGDEEMAKEVMNDERHLANNPRQATFEDVLTMFEKIGEELRERRTA